jgi:hypothetical protein
VEARRRVGLGLVVAAAALGILGDALFYGRPPGANGGLWAAAFVGVLAVLLRLGRVPLHQGAA